MLASRRVEQGALPTPIDAGMPRSDAARNDAETGLIRFGARDYDPQIGR